MTVSQSYTLFSIRNEPTRSPSTTIGAFNLPPMSDQLVQFSRHVFRFSISFSRADIGGCLSSVSMWPCK